MFDQHPEHILWDWNGTLLNDVELCVSVMNELLNEQQLPRLDSERYRHIFEFPVINYYHALGFHQTNCDFTEMGKRFIDNYHLRLNQTALHTDAVSTLTSIQQLGIPQSILSANQQDNLEKAVTHWNLDSYFERLLGISHIYADSKLERGKEFIELTQLAPEKIIMIGDTCHDAEVAKACGFNCILLSHGHQNAEKLHEREYPVCESFSEILNYLKQN